MDDRDVMYIPLEKYKQMMNKPTQKQKERKKMDKIKPCPFCGGAGKIEKSIGKYEYWKIQCQLCGVSTLVSVDKDLPVKWWNKRVKYKGGN